MDFGLRKQVKTEREKAGELRQRIISKISHEALRHVYYVFLSEALDKELLAYEYIIRGFRIGAQVDDHLGDALVVRVLELSGKVGAEAHRLKGLLRFGADGQGGLYAKVDSDHRVLPLLASCFMRRLAGRRWKIHDARRGLVAVSDGSAWRIRPEGECALPAASAEEPAQALWKEYFRTIAIKERHNPRLQRRCMPRRYWKNLTEMQEDEKPLDKNNY
jgi:probable DNA metabolism protein